VFHRRRWFEGGTAGAAGLLDIAWFAPDGSAMTGARWHGSDGNVVGVFMSADGLVGDDGRAIADDSFYVAFNGTGHDVGFVLPDGPFARGWMLVLDTAAGSGSFAAPGERPVDGTFLVAGQSVVVLQRVEHVTA
jgi:glycogen operon protein